MTLQNVYEGVRMRGRCTVSDYKSQDCGSAVFAGTGSMPHVRDSVVIGSVESGMTLFRTDGALIEDVSFDDGPLADNIDVIESSNVTIRRCQFAGTNIVQFQGGSTGFVDDCTFQESPTIALNLVINSNVEVRNSQFSGSGTSARSSDFSFLSGSGNLFAMNSTNTLRFTSQGGASLTNNDIRISETGYTVELSGYSINPDIIEIDLTSNYWGTTDLDSIAGEILDFNDLSGIKGIVNFEPVRTTSVPIQVRSLGELKALFRGKDD
jgi:ribosomal protein L24E